MKKILPWLAFLLGLSFVVSGLRPPPRQSEFDIEGFGHLPVLVNGRIKPIDTVARTTLLVLQDRQMVYRENGERPLSPNEWLLDVIYRQEKADAYRTFKIDNMELLGLVGKTEESIKIEYPDTARRVLAIFGFVPSRYRRFTYNEISPFLAELDRQAQLAEAVDAPVRNAFQKSVLALHSNLITYQQLKYSFVLPQGGGYVAELRGFQEALPKGIEAARAKQAGQPHDEAMADKMVQAVKQFETMARFSSLLTVPPAAGKGPSEWRKMGQALEDTFKTGEVNPAALNYAAIGDAWIAQGPQQFNLAVGRLRDYFLGAVGERLHKIHAEVRFNQAEPFYKAMTLYAIIFLIAIASWIRWQDVIGRAAFFLLLAAFLATTGGIITRMLLEGRPPVTNLYSSALFVGWAAVGLCLILEGVYKNAVGIVAGSAIGFCTLLIAHHLSLGGDTLEMMRAVLDSNFWLATHVVVITMGYASTFLAGFLAIIYILMGICTKWLNASFDRRAVTLNPAAPTGGAVVMAFSREPVKPAATKTIETNGQAIQRMVYGIVCFATLFSLIGTILGGIWADQSWGRFWGWDPKENGALIIVIWNALILHARWGGMVKTRGLMCLAVFGNIVTSWSWFGVNMLGIGLHSYGFMDQAFVWLMVFMGSQVLLVLIGSLTPLESWRSFRSLAARSSTPGYKASAT